MSTAKFRRIGKAPSKPSTTAPSLDRGGLDGRRATPRRRIEHGSPERFAVEHTLPNTQVRVSPVPPDAAIIGPGQN